MTDQHFIDIVLIGRASVGKYSIIRALKKEPFMESFFHDRGIDFVPYEISKADEIFTLRLWLFHVPTNYPSIFKQLTPVFTASRTIILVINPNMDNDRVIELFQDTIKKFKFNQHIILAHNLEYTPDQKTEIKSLAKLASAELFLTSAKTNEGIDELRDYLVSLI